MSETNPFAPPSTPPDTAVPRPTVRWRHAAVAFGIGGGLSGSVVGMILALVGYALLFVDLPIGPGMLVAGFGCMGALFGGFAGAFLEASIWIATRRKGFGGFASGAIAGPVTGAVLAAAHVLYAQIGMVDDRSHGAELVGFVLGALILFVGTFTAAAVPAAFLLSRFERRSASRDNASNGARET